MTLLMIMFLWYAEQKKIFTKNNIAAIMINKHVASVCIFFYFVLLLFGRKRVISRWIRAFLSNYHLHYSFHIQDLILKEKKQKEHWIRSHVNLQMAKQAVWLIEKFSNHTSLVKSISFFLIYYCLILFFFFASVSAVSIFSLVISVDLSLIIYALLRDV